MDSSEQMVCVNHPNRTTTLRCNRCGQPVCIACVVRTPVGYRCKPCVSAQQKVFITARWHDYPAAFLVAAFLSGLGSLIGSLLGFLILFLGYGAGWMIARAVQWAVRYRRGRYLRAVAIAGTVMGALPPLLIQAIIGVVGLLSGVPGEVTLSVFLSMLWPVAYLIIAVITANALLKGPQI